jgi:NADP-dependent 3-hydroxy acid dehydrogenase YdfG
MRGHALYFDLDVASSDDWRTSIASTVETYDALNVLVNNAGTATIAAVEATSDEEWETSLSRQGYFPRLQTLPTHANRSMG